ncbi:MAG TPA: hypothetical protein VHV79_11435 [Mycobacteriales bacterium]|nr:hypothetical protein [Mycobacteriales bacterium]
MPGKLSVKSIERSGRIRLRMVNALSTRISVGVALRSDTAGSVSYFSNSGKTVKLKTKHAKLVTETSQGSFALRADGSPAT